MIRVRLKYEVNAGLDLIPSQGGSGLQTLRSTGIYNNIIQKKLGDKFSTALHRRGGGHHIFHYIVNQPYFLLIVIHLSEVSFVFLIFIQNAVSELICMIFN